MRNTSQDFARIDQRYALYYAKRGFVKAWSREAIQPCASIASSQQSPCFSLGGQLRLQKNPSTCIHNAGPLQTQPRVARSVNMAASIIFSVQNGMCELASVCMAQLICIVDAHFTHESKVCMHDPRIVAQSPDLRFAERNPRMVRIRALRRTYIYILYHDTVAQPYDQVGPLPLAQQACS